MIKYRTVRELLECPACRGPFCDEGEALRCACGTYPVVFGIPVLTAWARNRSFSLPALLARYRPAARGWVARILRRVATGEARLRESIARTDATFLRLAGDFGRESDLDYFRYRFSDLSYIGSCALAAPIARGPVLDLACGAGHFERALGRKRPPLEVVGADLSFPLLYLAKRFVAPGASFVCADARDRLPFRSGAFEAALCLDAFYYFPDRAAAGRELLRVSRGPVLVSHLGDPAFRGPAVQPLLEPETYLRLFAERDPHLHSERRLLEGFFRRQTLDLSRAEPDPRLVLSLAAGVERRDYAGADYFVGGTRVNPIYDVREEGDVLHLRRRPLSAAHDEACRRFEGFLPESLTLTKAQAASGDPALARSFVLLDLPPQY